MLCSQEGQKCPFLQDTKVETFNEKAPIKSLGNLGVHEELTTGNTADAPRYSRDSSWDSVWGMAATRKPVLPAVITMILVDSTAKIRMWWTPHDICGEYPMNATLFSWLTHLLGTVLLYSMGLPGQIQRKAGKER